MAATDLNLHATELRLGLPGSRQQSDKKLPNSNKRSSSEMEKIPCPSPNGRMAAGGISPEECPLQKDGVGRKWDFVKVSMDGAPYLRKIDLSSYRNYLDLMKALETMFKCTIGVYTEREGYDGSEFAPTYEDKDGDWMLVGDVPWEMFVLSCKRLRIMKGSEAKGLGGH
ncbi:hypothetical protein F511_03621 [Dorcoceras hygrometricum]|uniref:Auxin-responsive protein n=1 Tax=Dorcoceras hygrometricum TaxID=472368 RepID=A0A2Z7DAT5_9LAMI|nr:hypothetical protein F511_03621 [Dorcoceras hygrometricum]